MEKITSSRFFHLFDGNYHIRLNFNLNDPSESRSKSGKEQEVINHCVSAANRRNDRRCPRLIMVIPSCPVILLQFK